jgi:dihydrofolate reductase
MLRDYVRHTATEHIFLIGGAETFAKFACVVDRWYIDKTSFDGPHFGRDWFDPMWLVESE